MSSPSQNDGPQGFQDQATGVGSFNATAFLVQQILNRCNFATLVKVVACTNSGGVSPVGFVDVQPLVNQLDGQNNSVPHGVVYGLPYLRLQGGSNAIIIDPVVGDIGMATFADRDISAVKASGAQSNPGSKRRNDMADGMYLGGMINGAPTQYIQFTASGLNIISPNPINVTSTTSVNVTAPVINMGASGQTLLGLIKSTVVAIYNGHTHPVSGAVTGAPNQPFSGSDVTTTIKGG